MKATGIAAVVFIESMRPTASSHCYVPLIIPTLTIFYEFTFLFEPFPLISQLVYGVKEVDSLFIHFLKAAMDFIENIPASISHRARIFHKITSHNQSL